MKLSVTWSTKRLGNEGFVLEERSDGTKHEFGPMPVNIVPAFVESRRRIIATMMDEASATEVDEDTFH